MTSYYNIFKDTEFITQNINPDKTYKSLKQLYQNGGDSDGLIYEDMSENSKLKLSKLEKQKTNSNSNSKFLKSCNQSKIQNFKQPMIQIGGFYIQL